ncbi:sensor histidine kinase [Noviherbaspirillum sp. Root189]|uniref:sensor histidine kinase n=1 Tax=Noviherbaspirillum sp. Root189 TaxID=1736487 RepID=UPI00070ADC17|nr:HAMP domain-containing sensor histidine kinase [Noviherbaspirillum sp. Root189]KRB83858.1 hypothetical protein ASE07_23330 [Noviherbaspirillum sp. Root189]
MKELTGYQLGAVACGVVSILIAMSALVGWGFGIPWLFRLPDSPPMFPATAVAFLLGSTSLLLQIREQSRYSGASILLALTVIGIGLVSSLLRALDWAPGPLTLAVFRETTYASVPGSVTSVMFITLGTSLGLMHARRTISLAQIVAVATLMFSMLVIAAYLSRGSFLHEFLPGRGGIAARTALAFLMLAAGILSLRPNDGLVAALTHSATGRPTVRELLLPAVVAPILLGVLLSTAIRVTDFNFEDTALIWLIVWGLITVLVIVVWRFAYRLREEEFRRSLAEKERNEAMEALRATDERKTVFLATLAHELKNPLAAIGTGADLLAMAQASSPDQVRRTGQLISRQVNHMAHLVDDLMDISRVVAGIIVLNKQKLDMKRLIAEALEQVHPLLESKGHRLRTELSTKEVQVEGDHNRLLQVFANLLSNSAKYTPDGGNLFLQMVVTGSELVINVQDDGIGIAPDLLPNVFDLFRQAERKSDRSQGGLGLGLALVKSLVELHGGKVAAHSDGLGKGSVFTVVLPKMVDSSQAKGSRHRNLELDG